MTERRSRRLQKENAAGDRGKTAFVFKLPTIQKKGGDTAIPPALNVNPNH